LTLTFDLLTFRVGSVFRRDIPCVRGGCLPSQQRREVESISDRGYRVTWVNLRRTQQTLPSMPEKNKTDTHSD